LKKKLPLFVLTIKNSKREFLIKKRLNFLKIKYKIFYAIDGRNVKNYKILDKHFNKKKCLNELGRSMSRTEISNAEGHLRIYKYIIKRNILSAIIMEDDCYPSKELCNWMKLDFFLRNKNYEIIQIYHSDGFAHKKPSEVISLQYFLHKTCSTLPYTTCYQITKKACEYITIRSKKISRLADWPVNFYNTKISQFVVLPKLVSLHFNHINTSHNKKAWTNFTKMEKIKKFLPFYNFITALYFLLHIPFLSRKYKNYSYYKEKYLLPKIYFLKNLFLNSYINLKNISKDKNFYPSDLKNVQ